jgi:hypothetical protein
MTNELPNLNYAEHTHPIHFLPIFLSHRLHYTPFLSPTSRFPIHKNLKGKHFEEQHTHTFKFPFFFFSLCPRLKFAQNLTILAARTTGLSLAMASLAAAL